MNSRLSIALAFLPLLLLGSAGTCATPGDYVPDLRFTEESFDIGCVGVDFRSSIPLRWSITEAIRSISKL